MENWFTLYDTHCFSGSSSFKEKLDVVGIFIQLMRWCASDDIIT